MTIKEYLKDHSERELVEKMTACGNEAVLKHTAWFNGEKEIEWRISEDHFIKSLKQANIEIEEEDYLAKARERVRFARRENAPESSRAVGHEEACDLYEKAIKQLQDVLVVKLVYQMPEK
jgi:histidinol dehydrogenase